MIVAGRITAFFTLVIILVLLWYFTRRAMAGAKLRGIRSIPALEAIEESVGRCVETNRPVLWVAGDRQWLTSDLSVQAIAGLSVLSYLAKLCAKYRAKLICAVGGDQGSGSDALPLIEEIVRESYLAEGKEDDFKRENLRYISAEQLAYAAGVMGLLERERPGANIMIGGWANCTIPIAETGNRLGAIQIGGTARDIMLPLFVTMCDYVLIGEEIFASAVKLKPTPRLVASIAVEDMIRWGALALIPLGAILLALGVRVRLIF